MSRTGAARANTVFMPVKEALIFKTVGLKIPRL